MRDDAVPGSGARSTGRRGKDRRPQIRVAAARLFQEHGYHQVGMGAIGAEVGISVGALYQYYAGKQGILDAIVLEELEAMTRAMRACAQPTLDDLVAAVLAHVIERPSGSEATFYHIRDCSPEVAAAARAELRMQAAMLGEVIAELRRDWSAATVEFVAWAELAIATSPATYHAKVNRTRQRDLLHRACRAVAELDLAELDLDGLDEGGGIGDEGVAVRRRGRREEVVGAFIDLALAKSYAVITMEDVAAAVGMVPSSLYNHFDGKGEIFRAALDRAAADLRAGMDQACRSESGQVERAVRNYVDVALAPRSPIALMMNEKSAVPEGIRREQGDYVRRWMELLGGPDGDVRTLVHGMLATVNFMARGERLRSRGATREQVALVAATVLRVTC